MNENESQYLKIRIAILLGLMATAPEASARVLEVETSSALLSRYFCEGRAVEEAAGGMITGTVAAAAGPVSGEVWYGYGLGGDYSELNATLAGSCDAGPLTLTGGITRVDSWTSGQRDAADHEYFVEVALPLGGLVETAASYVYSENAAGGLFTLTADCALASHGDMAWSANLLAAWDFGYASEAFDGGNHIEAGTTVTVSITEAWTLAGAATIVLPLEDARRDGASVAGYVAASVTRSW